MNRQHLIWSLLLTLLVGSAYGFTVNNKRMVIEGDSITLFRTSSAARTVTDAQIYKWDNMSTSGGYVHPATHPASMIVPDSTRRFVTDAEKTTWNGKQSPATTLAGYGIIDAAPSSHVGSGGSAHSAATTATAGFMSTTDKTKLDGLSNYTHPASHPPTIITQDSSNRFVTDAEKTTWNGKQSPATTLAGYGITDAAPSSHLGLGGSAHSAATTGTAGFLSTVDKLKLDGLSNYSHPASHPPSIITQDSSNRFATDAEKTTWNGKQAPATTLAGYGITDAAPSSHLGLGGSAHSAATTGTAGFLSTVDKLKLDGLSNYSHPASHPPSIITQDSSNRFATDAEKTAWNGKQTPATTLAGYGITDAVGGNTITSVGTITLTGGDSVLLANPAEGATVRYHLPAYATVGAVKRYKIKNIGQGVSEIDGVDGKLVDGEIFISLAPGDRCEVVKDGANWQVI